jgi:hypothetical protein
MVPINDSVFEKPAQNFVFVLRTNQAKSNVGRHLFDKTRETVFSLDRVFAEYQNSLFMRHTYLIVLGFYFLIVIAPRIHPLICFDRVICFWYKLLYFLVILSLLLLVLFLLLLLLFISILFLLLL